MIEMEAEEEKIVGCEMPSKETNVTETTSITSNIANVQKDSTTATDNNPYSYLEQEFTSENFKIEEMKKLLNNKLKLGANKLKSPGRNNNWAFICFRSEEDRVKAIQVLNGFNWKGKTLTAENAKAVPDPLLKRQLEEASAPNSKKQKGDVEEQIQDAVTPLWRMPYKEQLEKKEAAIKQLLKGLADELIQVNPDLKEWVNLQTEKYAGLPCEFTPIKYSPSSQDGYRNKCEFTIGFNEATGEKTVGFRLGSYAMGSVSVAPVDSVKSVPLRMKEAVQVFQKFVRASKLDVFNAVTHQGYWRQLTARVGFNTGDLMLIVGLHPQTLTAEELKSIGEEVTAFFVQGDGKECQVTSLYLQLIGKRRTAKDDPGLVHLTGEKYLKEKVLDKSFRISPLAFFQTNTAGTEVLYRSIEELAGLSENTSLVDVCCGTGSIGICLSDACGEVLGLELCEAAVTDARENASMNNVKKATFFAGKAEQILSAVVHKASCEEVIAVVDPPRAGLNQNAMVQIRKMKNLDKLVYVSCNPKASCKNLVDLARPGSKLYHRQAFLPVKAVAVDMFPFTDHCELIMYLERLPDNVENDENDETVQQVTEP